MNFRSKLCPLEGTEGFSKIWPSNLVFDLTWQNFKPDLDIMMINNLTKFHELWIRIVPFRVYTSFFSKILPNDLVFDPTWPSLELDLDIIIFHVSWTVNQICAL